MKMKHLSIASFFLVVSCSNVPVTNPDISSYYKKWLSYKIHDYSIDQRRSCFCIDGGELMRITVKSDTKVSVMRISDSSIISSPYCLTIDSLFGLIRDLKADSVVVRYNEEYGYPEFIDVDPQMHPVDGGYLYETNNLQILQ